VADDDLHPCSVEECVRHASERAPGVYFCDDHWAALCDAYARQRPAGGDAGTVPAA
jgi:hypothetical protein